MRGCTTRFPTPIAIPERRSQEPRGLRTQADLDFFEEEATAQRFTEPLPAGKFDARHLRAIHRHLFQDVYAWAGSPRTADLKGGSSFCYPRTSTARLGAFSLTWRSRNSFGPRLGIFCQQAAHFLAELNPIHPFREGNGRTQLSFMTALANRPDIRSRWSGSIPRQCSMRPSPALVAARSRWPH